MPRSVFFSFHYQRDAWRVSQVRNSWVTKARTANRFLDAADWESVKSNGAAGIKSWIDRQLKGTSVTVVLVGSQTASRRYVKYEIEQSLAKGNGLVAVLIHGIKDQRGKPSAQGRNPLDDFEIESDGLFSWLFPTMKASEKFATRDWVEDDGYRNLNAWIEDAATKVNR
jgi:hypothetical protein